MNAMPPLFAAAILMLASHGYSRAEEAFEKVTIHLEQNVDDEDVEILIHAYGPETGLATLKVVAPDGRTVIDFRAPDSKLGLRQVTFESPEPKNDGKLQADYPEGVYQFTGSTVAGATLRGEASLSHKLPATTSALHPLAGAEGVPVADLQLRWNPVSDLSAWTVVLEHEATGREIRMNLPATITAMAVPDGFLIPGTKYKLAIGAVTEAGNKSVTEMSFTTAGR